MHMLMKAAVANRLSDLMLRCWTSSCIAAHVNSAMSASMAASQAKQMQSASCVCCHPILSSLQAPEIQELPRLSCILADNPNTRVRAHLRTEVPEHKVVVCASCDQLVAPLDQRCPQCSSICPHLQRQ